MRENRDFFVPVSIYSLRAPRFLGLHDNVCLDITDSADFMQQIVSEVTRSNL